MLSASGTWHTVHGARHREMVCGAWCVVCGAWCMVHGAWCCQALSGARWALGRPNLHHELHQVPANSSSDLRVWTAHFTCPRPYPKRTVVHGVRTEEGHVLFVACQLTGQCGPRHPGCMVGDLPVSQTLQYVQGRCRLRLSSQQRVIKNQRGRRDAVMVPMNGSRRQGHESQWRVVGCLTMTRGCVTCFSLDRVVVLVYVHTSLWRELWTPSQPRER